MPPRDKALVDLVASQTADAELVYLFGSCGTASERPDSDLDVAVLYPAALSVEARARLVERLERASGREVDLLDLASADPIIRRQVLASGVLVLCRSPRLRAELEMTTLSEYLDLKIDRREAERQLVESYL